MKDLRWILGLDQVRMRWKQDYRKEQFASHLPKKKLACSLRASRPVATQNSVPDTSSSFHRLFLIFLSWFHLRSLLEKILQFLIPSEFHTLKQLKELLKIISCLRAISPNHQKLRFVSTEIRAVIQPGIESEMLAEMRAGSWAGMQDRRWIRSQVSYIKCLPF